MIVLDVYLSTMNNNKLEINWITYVREDSIHNTEKVKKDWLTYCIVRTYSAWVFAWRYDLNKINKVWTVYEARRLRRRWSDFTLSALANLWAKKGKEWENKYAMPVDEVYLTEIVEVIPCTQTAQKFIIWQPNYAE